MKRTGSGSVHMVRICTIFYGYGDIKGNRGDMRTNFGIVLWL
jgi:hypothetical protein